MADPKSYIDICKGEIEACRQRLAELEDAHIREAVGNGEWRDITEELREEQRHTMSVYETIVAALEKRADT
jgi:hypothetical protein